MSASAAIPEAPAGSAPSPPGLPGPAIPVVRLGALRAGALLLVYFALQLVAGGAVGVAAGLSFAFTARDLGRTGFEAVVQAAAPLGAIVGVAVGALGVVALARAWAGPLRFETGPRGVGFAWGPPRPLALGAGAGLVLAAAYLGLALHLAAPPDPGSLGPTARMAATPGWSRLAWTLLALVLAPPAEEYLFRGVLLAGFARSWGPVAAGVAVSLLFAAVHLPETAHFWPAIVATGALGLLALALRWTTGRLGPAVAAHAAYNLVMVLSVS